MRQKIGLALSSGLLFWLAWPPFSYSFPLLFVAFVPLLFLVKKVEDEQRLFPFTFLAFVVWNTLCTWWITYASAIGAVIAILLNALLMSMPFLVYRRFWLRGNKGLAYGVLIAGWLSFEYFHLNWDLSWPWMTLGNGFAECPALIQWYEYTGTLGGSLWILLSNVLVFEFLQCRLQQNEQKVAKRMALALIAVWLLPTGISLIRYTTYEEAQSPSNVVIVQPNIDPYNEKFEEGSAEKQVKQLLKLTAGQIQANTEYILWPETALPDGLWEEQLSSYGSIKKTRDFLYKYKNANLITGAATYKQYATQKTVSARKFKSGECCYDAFNTAIQLQSGGDLQIYHKSKLVPGVEQMPYPKVFGFLESLALDMGGTSGSLGKQEERTVFYSESGIGVAPVICYESIYGDYVAEYVRNGAQFIAIITNDGWWSNTDGYRQHEAYARLRAIETRRSIARSANTGISCFIDQKGDVLEATKWWEADAIKRDINLNSDLTFYVKNGDYIAVLSVIVTALLLIHSLIEKYLKK